ncbi:MAG: hypothetical protein KIT45_04890 [Fimbriimonadia bacterium]|nr:hypothetical protein [Fimbriimonadia bacterium]
MPKHISLQVSDRVARQATRLAKQSQRPVEDILTDWLEWAASEMPVEMLSDEEVLELSDLQLSVEQQATLSDLLAQQQDNRLDEEAKHQLDELMRFYEHGLLRKAQALREAVHRGLREPLQS